MDEGKAKSIGLSDIRLVTLKGIMAIARSKPAVVREIREGVGTSVRFNRVVETGAPGFVLGPT